MKHVGEWGYCDEKCTGQTPQYQSIYNIAIRDEYWELSITITSINYDNFFLFYGERVL